jgi:hypothetical protein
MLTGVPQESATGESRVAATPEPAGPRRGATP